MLHLESKEREVVDFLLEGVIQSLIRFRKLKREGEGHSDESRVLRLLPFLLLALSREDGSLAGGSQPTNHISNVIMISRREKLK
jgi:hypothetical protein